MTCRMTRRMNMVEILPSLPQARRKLWYVRRKKSVSEESNAKLTSVFQCTSFTKTQQSRGRLSASTIYTQFQSCSPANRRATTVRDNSAIDSAALVGNHDIQIFRGDLERIDISLGLPCGNSEYQEPTRKGQQKADLSKIGAEEGT